MDNDYISTVTAQGYSAPSLGGAQLFANTVIIATNTVYAYTADWPLSPTVGAPEYFWNLLDEGTNYISIQAFDIMHDSSTTIDAFFVRKDTTAPTITNNQAGDTTWRSANTGVYNSDCADLTSGTTEADYQIKDGSGVTLVPWTSIFMNPAGQASYIADWPVSAAAFNSLSDGTTGFVYVRCFDAAGNLSAPATSYFYILKDTDVPTVQVSAQKYYMSSHDLGAKNYAGFFDPMVPGRSPGASGLNTIQYYISTGTAMSGNPVQNWTAIATLSGSATWYASNWAISNFSSLPGATTLYVSLQAADLAGNTTIYMDAFRVFRSTIAAPVITNNQTGDFNWYTSSTTFLGQTYNVGYQSFDNDFLSTGTITAWSGANQTGTNFTAGWIPVISTGGVFSYSTPWKLSPPSYTGFAPEFIWNLLGQGTNYISFEAYDAALDSSTKNDVFFILKDTDTPIAQIATQRTTRRGITHGEIPAEHFTTSVLLT